MAVDIDVNSKASVASAVMLGTLGVLSFIVQPALVQGFVTHLGLNEPQAVNLAGLEMLGVAIATVLLAIPRLVTDWRRALAVGLTLAITGNLASAAMAGSPYLWTARLAAGLGHGAIISLSFSFIGLTTRVERNVAIYLVSLLSYGAFGLWIMPPLLDGVGVSGLFVIFAILASLAVALAGVLAYNIAQGIAWAILFLIGIDAGLGEADVGYALFISQIFAIVGALLSVFFAERFGRWGPIALGIFAGGACIALLLNRPEFNIFLLAVCGFNLLWNFVLPFILGAVGDFDTRGRMMGPAIAMQMIGLGGGPLLAAILISGGSYQTALLLCIGFFVASYILLTIPMLHHRKILQYQSSI